MRNMRLARPVARLRAGQTDWYRVTDRVVNANGATSAEVYIYDEIGYWGVTAGDFAKELVGLDVTNITLHLNSPGGEVYDGMAIYNCLKDHPANVHVIVDGLAASAASFIMMAGDKISFQRNAEAMIHDAMGMCVGPAEDMDKMSADLKRISANIADIYAQRCGGTAKQWRDMMLAETWFSAQEALKAGLCDEVLGMDPVVSDSVDWDLSIFAHTCRKDAPAPSIETKPVVVEDVVPDYDPSAIVDALRQTGRL